MTTCSQLPERVSFCAAQTATKATLAAAAGTCTTGSDTAAAANSRRMSKQA